MDKGFWQGKWQRNEIAFHEREANPLLVKYFGELNLAKGSRIFLPCAARASTFPGCSPTATGLPAPN